MALEFNPFHKWLGIDPKIANPHHFQLLGVSPKLSDDSEIKKSVESGVQKCLAGLAKVPQGQHEELVKKLKHRIAVARKTLLDPKLRVAYIAKLKAQIQAQKSAKTSGRSPASSKAAKFTTPTLSDIPAAALNPPPLPAPVVPVSASDQPVPMAMPLPPSSDPQSIAVNSDGVAIDEVRIDKNVNRKRRKSKAGLIVGALLLVSATVGVMLIIQNKDALMKLSGAEGKVEEDSVVPKASDIPIGANKEEANAKEEVKEQVKLPSFDLDSLPELDIDEVMSDPQTQAATRRDAERQAMIRKRNEERIAKMGLDDPSDEPLTPEMKAERDRKSEENSNATASPVGPLVSFDEFQLSKIRRHLQRAQRSLARHDLDASRKAIDYANSVLVEVTKNRPAHFDETQAPIANLVPQTKEIHDLIIGFWKQVVNSSEEVPGGQELEVSGQKIGFVESSPEMVIVRHAGENVVYQFDFCPRSLAVALATQGTIPDIPTWNKQLSAFYAVDQIVNDLDHSETIDPLLMEAEEAGHDCEGIRSFSEYLFGKTGSPAEKIEMPKPDKLDELLSEFRDENGYKNPEQLTVGVALMMSELLLQIDSPNFEQHVALLEESRRIGIKASDASVVEDAIIELERFANVNRGSLTCESFSAIGKEELTDASRRKLIERAIPFLKSEHAESADSKLRDELASEILEIATREKMIDAVRRLNQIVKD